MCKNYGTQVSTWIQSRNHWQTIILHSFCSGGVYNLFLWKKMVSQTWDVSVLFHHLHSLIEKRQSATTYDDDQARLSMPISDCFHILQCAIVGSTEFPDAQVAMYARLTFVALAISQFLTSIHARVSHCVLFSFKFFRFTFLKIWWQFSVN